MTTDMNSCHVAKSGNIITAKGRASYAQYLIEPQKNQSGKLKYNLNLLLPPESDLTVLKNAMGKIALEKCDGDKKRAVNFVNKRLLDPNNLPNGGKPAGDEFEGWTLIRASSDYKPKFAYPNGKAIPDEEIKNELYSGRFVRATINPYWSANDTNPGVFLGLQNVQLLDHADNMGVAMPDVEDEFDAVEGDFGGDTSSEGETTGDDVDSMF